MPGGYNASGDPEFQDGRNRLQADVNLSGKTSWEGEGNSDGDGGGSGKSCSIIAASLITGSGIAAAYIGHKYGGVA